MTSRKIVDTEKKVRPLEEKESELVNAGYEAGMISERKRILMILEHDKDAKINLKTWKLMFPNWPRE